MRNILVLLVHGLFHFLFRLSGPGPRAVTYFMILLFHTILDFKTRELVPFQLLAI